VQTIAGRDHVLAMVVVGPWGAQPVRPAQGVLPTLFTIVMALGGFAVFLGARLNGVEYGVAISVFLLRAIS